MATVDPKVINDAATAKKTFDSANANAVLADKAWKTALVSLKLVSSPGPVRRPVPSLPSKTPGTTVPATPAPVPTTSQLQSLADAKIAADTALTTATTNHRTAQNALSKALKDAGAQ